MGPTRGDIHAATVATVVANVNSKKRFTVEDFIPEWDREPVRVVLTPEQVWERTTAVMMGLAGGKAGENGDDAS